MSLEKRLSKLEHKHEPLGSIEVWLFDLDGETATGPDGKRYKAEEAEQLQAESDPVIDLRRRL